MYCFGPYEDIDDASVSLQRQLAKRHCTIFDILEAATGQLDWWQRLEDHYTELMPDQLPNVYFLRNNYMYREQSLFDALSETCASNFHRYGSWTCQTPALDDIVITSVSDKNVAAHNYDKNAAAASVDAEKPRVGLALIAMGPHPRFYAFPQGRETDVET